MKRDYSKANFFLSVARWIWDIAREIFESLFDD